MKKIKLGEVYEAMPEPDGLIYSCFAGMTEKGEMGVDFINYSFAADMQETVEKDVYQLLKFGANYSKILNNCKNYINAKTIILSDSKVFMLENNGTAFLFDANGEMLWQGFLKYKSRVPYSIAVTKDGLWGTFPEFDSVVRFNPTTMRNELRLGKKGDLFSSPKGLFAVNNDLYVCSYDGQKLLKIDSETYKTEVVYTFNEPLEKYIKIKDREFVILKSGLYEID